MNTFTEYRRHAGRLPMCGGCDYWEDDGELKQRCADCVIAGLFTALVVSHAVIETKAEIRAMGTEIARLRRRISRRVYQGLALELR